LQKLELQKNGKTRPGRPGISSIGDDQNQLI